MDDAQADRILNWERSPAQQKGKVFEIRSRVRDIIAGTNKLEEMRG